MGSESIAARQPIPLSPLRQQGFSLLEVLVALLVLAIGVLGAVLAQTKALRYSASAADRTQATFIAYDLLDRMRANPAELASYATTVSTGCLSPASATSILNSDLADFAHAVSCLLPGGYGAVEIHGYRATITINWSEERIVAGAGETSLVTSSLIRSDP